jgi:hypothetical protein
MAGDAISRLQCPVIDFKQVQTIPSGRAQGLLVIPAVVDASLCYPWRPYVFLTLSTSVFLTLSTSAGHPHHSAELSRGRDDLICVGGFSARSSITSTTVPPASCSTYYILAK